MKLDRTELEQKDPVIGKLEHAEEAVWANPRLTGFDKAMEGVAVTMADVDDAERRLARFAPFIAKSFPETLPQNGIIESPLQPIPAMREVLNKKYGARLTGRLLLKQDSHLAISGSVKARGGIYEILKHSEDLALEHGLISMGESYEKFASPELQSFFRERSIHVGSTGNLGLSIGIISAALGYKVTVHMSTDARQWKKDLLRSKGVQVIEYDSDYSAAVVQGRKLAEQDPMSYFVDDENSVNLFLGYAVAAKRLVRQLEALDIPVDGQHPLFVYLPCGVGGAPGGVTFGLKQMFGDNVHCFFVEPTQAPCMLLGMATGLQNEISVQDIGLTGLTCADGLAVGRPSKFVGRVMDRMLAGEFTVRDGALYDYMRDLLGSEGIFIEPSACASFQGPARFSACQELKGFIDGHGLAGKLPSATHIAWATGGSMVPEEERQAYNKTYL